MGIVVLEGLILDVLKLEKSDFVFLVEICLILEIKVVELVVLCCMDEDLYEIEKVFKVYE